MKKSSEGIIGGNSISETPPSLYALFPGDARKKGGKGQLNNAYLYLSMGSILAMLILGAYMQAPHFAGNLGILFSLGMLAATGYDCYKNQSFQTNWIPLACAGALLIISLMVHGKKDAEECAKE